MSDLEILFRDLNFSNDIDILNEIQDELFSENGVSRHLSEANVRKFLRFLPKSNEDENYGWEFSQIDPYYQPKATFCPSDLNLDDIDIMNLDPDCTSQSKILVIYTGGTIGMRLKNDGYQAESNYFCKALRKLPMFHDGNVKSDIISQYWNVFIMPLSREGRRVMYVVLEYDPLLDSTDITFDDYIHIARDIESEYEKYDGFIILHGTDTLAYTASSLSFLLENLSKPVLLTGAQIPVFELRSDGRENFLTSLLLVSHYNIPEVMIFFHEKLMRANRCSKISSLHFDAFDSPNFPPLANIGVDIVINSNLMLDTPNGNKKFNIQTNLCPDVSVLRMFPSITCQTVAALLGPPIQGVVLQSFGCGNLSICREDILQCLKNAYDRGVIIINISQCNHGGVKGIYKSGSILKRYGIISGYDMTPEAALAKLAYVLGNTHFTLEEKRRLMSTNLRGEISLESLKKTKRPTQESLIMSKKVVIMAMCSASRIGDIKMLEKIGKHYGEWNCANKNGRTPLHIAAKANQIDVVKFLLCKGIENVNITDHNNYTPLLDAVTGKSDPHLIKLLIENGAYIKPERFIDNMIIKSIIEDDFEILNLFFMANYDMNIVDDDYNTPLHLATINNHYDLVVWLVEIVKINTRARNVLSQTALDEAYYRGHQMIFEYLRERND